MNGNLYPWAFAQLFGVSSSLMKNPNPLIGIFSEPVTFPSNKRSTIFTWTLLKRVIDHLATKSNEFNTSVHIQDKQSQFSSDEVLILKMDHRIRNLFKMIKQSSSRLSFEECLVRTCTTSENTRSGTELKINQGNWSKVSEKQWSENDKERRSRLLRGVVSEGREKFEKASNFTRTIDDWKPCERDLLSLINN